ncbi:MAG TPA: class I SAM-dependent methyltransferase [Rhizomicrobium sp.]
MDDATLRAYDLGAAGFAEDWETQPAPTDLHATVRRYFTPGPTADIGCGSGRDTAWLNANGYPAIGFDASEALLREARRRHPSIEFRHAELPALANAEEPFANILCETVIMHLPHDAISASVARILSLLTPGGTLYLSWRVTKDADRRDDHGRLYAAFDPDLVLTPLASARILLDEQVGSISSGKLIRRIVARR